MFTDTQRREIFHFCFLERLLKLSSPDWYILKGGVNLRFFFHSPRYSEDMDLDVTGGNVATLKKNGYKILSDAAFIRTLATYGIDGININDPDKAKHTETTQRFRCQLVTSSGVSLPTKIEFSRRGGALTGPPKELILPDIARRYRRLSYACHHYPGDMAALQKIRALAGRPATQARDVFDLYLLHLGGYASDFSGAAELPENIRHGALEATLSLDYADYQGQVVEFLEEDKKAEFGTASTWETMQHEVLRLMENA